MQMTRIYMTAFQSIYPIFCGVNIQSTSQINIFDISIQFYPKSSEELTRKLVQVNECLILHSLQFEISGGKIELLRNSCLQL